MHLSAGISVLGTRLNRTIDNALIRTENSTTSNKYPNPMQQLTANDLKVRGIAAIESVLAEQTEAAISVRGKERFVVMDMAHYHYLRECELEAALMQSKADLAAGRVVQETAQDHMARLDALLSDNAGH
jgi:PHD/YefM family antitoxin component YafN of YafNO toxin-antitoxin module